MNPVKQAINDIISQKMDTYTHPRIGTISAYDAVHFRAQVDFKDNVGAVKSSDWLPLPNAHIGFHSIEPRPGWKANLSFINGDIDSPKIDSIFVSTYSNQGNYKDRLTTEYGASIPDLFSFL